jgi:hypothetical protein
MYGRRSAAARLVVVVLAAVAMLGLAVPAAQARLAKVTGGQSDMDVNIAAVAQLQKDQVYTQILPPATLTFFKLPPTAHFPITGGALETLTMLGTVNHAGGIRILKCAPEGCWNGILKTLDSTDLKFLNGNMLVGDAHGLIPGSNLGMPTPSADLVNTSHSRDSNGTVHFEGDVQMNLATATVLNVYFSTNVFTSGLILGHMNSTIQTK